MHANAELIARFYTAFGHRDAAGMAACYHPEVQFSDEVFPDLRGDRATAMWRMLCERGKDLRVKFVDIVVVEQLSAGIVVEVMVVVASL